MTLVTKSAGFGTGSDPERCLVPACTAAGPAAAAEPAATTAVVAASTRPHHGKLPFQALGEAWLVAGGETIRTAVTMGTDGHRGAFVSYGRG